MLNEIVAAADLYLTSSMLCVHSRGCVYFLLYLMVLVIFITASVDQLHMCVPYGKTLLSLYPKILEQYQEEYGFNEKSSEI